MTPPLLSVQAGTKPAAAFHDLENRDQPDELFWRETAAKWEEGSLVLELGAGTGRLTELFLDQGLFVTAVDSDPELMDELRGRHGGTVRLRPIVDDARSLHSGAAGIRRFDVAIAPAQFMQLFARGDRERIFHAVAESLKADGVFYASIHEDLSEAIVAHPAHRPKPDRQGLRFASQVIASTRSGAQMRAGGPRGVVDITRRRRDWLRFSTETVRYHEMSAADLVAEAHKAGFRNDETYEIPMTADHVGSTILRFRPHPR